ncbi:MAG: phosphatidylglycerol lysyltransferase domain-containing protein [Stenotrophobium sp.]
MSTTLTLTSMSWMAASGGIGYGAVLLKNRRQRQTHSARLCVALEPAETLLSAQARYGYNPHALISLHQDGRVWRHPSSSGGIVFQRVGNVWLAAGDPISPASEQRSLVASFFEAALAAGAMPAFVPATEQFARNALDWGYTVVKVGASPYFDLQSWDPRGNHARHLRWSINRARREDLHIEATSFQPTLADECREVCASWLATRPAAANFGWLFSLEPMCFGEHKRFFTARNRQGTLVGLLAASPIPDRKGWYLEDVLRRGDSPDGTADLLVYEALTTLRLEGYSEATLGTALLAEDGADLTPSSTWTVTQFGLRQAKKALGDVYHFDGIRNFKAKFVPSRWEGEYAIVPHPGSLIPFQVVSAILKVMLPDGMLSILQKRKPASAGS